MEKVDVVVKKSDIINKVVVSKEETTKVEEVKLPDPKTIEPITEEKALKLNINMPEINLEAFETSLQVADVTININEDK